MLKPIATGLIVLAALAGCDSRNPSAPAAGTAASNEAPAAAPQGVDAPIPSEITGTISLREPAVINPGAKLSVQLVDVAQQEVALATHNEDLTSQPPYSFRLPMNPAGIDRTRVYVVNVEITDGERHYTQALQAPVLTGGAGSDIKIVLNAEATPGELLKADFNKLKNHIGGMRRIQDAFLDGDLSVAWDGFVEPGNRLRFMRVNTELGEGDTAVRSNVEYAFLNDKPMALLVKGRANSRLGWDENGQLILNERGGGETFTPEEAQKYYDDAMKAFAMAQPKMRKKR